VCLLIQKFSIVDFQKLFSSPQCAHLTFCIKHDTLANELAIGLLCRMHAVTECCQIEWCAAVTISVVTVAISSQPALLI